MAETSWPSPAHNSRAVTDYEYERLVGRYAADGVIDTAQVSYSGAALSNGTVGPVYADSTGLQVKVQANAQALVRGFLWDSGTSVSTVSIAANSAGSTRTDVIVLRLDRSAWTVRLGKVQGTAGAGVPALTQATGASGVYELPLAWVTVADGATTIAAGDVLCAAWRAASAGAIIGNKKITSAVQLSSGQNQVIAQEVFTVQEGRRYKVNLESTYNFQNSGSSATLRLRYEPGSSVTTSSPTVGVRYLETVTAGKHLPVTFCDSFLATSSGVYSAGVSCDFATGTGLLFFGSSSTNEMRLTIHAAS